MVFITKKINKELWSVNPMSRETVSLAGRRFFFSHYAQDAYAIEWIMISVLKWIISFTLKSI